MDDNIIIKKSELQWNVVDDVEGCEGGQVL